MTKYKNQIAENIKQVRTSLGLTQEAFAEAFNAIDDGLKTSRLGILKYEKGINIPPGDKYVKIMNMGGRDMNTQNVRIEEICETLEKHPNVRSVSYLKNLKGDVYFRIYPITLPKDAPSDSAYVYIAYDATESDIQQELNNIFRLITSE